MLVHTPTRRYFTAASLFNSDLLLKVKHSIEVLFNNFNFCLKLIFKGQMQEENNGSVAVTGFRWFPARGCEFTVTPYCRRTVRARVMTVYWYFYLKCYVCGIRWCSQIWKCSVLMAEYHLGKPSRWIAFLASLNISQSVSRRLGTLFFYSKY